MLQRLFFISCMFFHVVYTQTNNMNELREKLASIQDKMYALTTQEMATLVNQPIDIKLISAYEVKKEIEMNPELKVVFVLSRYIYNDCKIKGSINTPIKEIIDIADTWDRNTPIIVYCASYECNAGEKSYLILKAMGFTNVRDYKGGMYEWFNEGYPTEGPCQLDYLAARICPCCQVKHYTFDKIDA